MGTKYWEVLCGELGIGGDGSYCGGNDAQLDVLPRSLWRHAVQNSEPNAGARPSVRECVVPELARCAH